MTDASLQYVLDSVILIDHLNGQRKATQFLTEHAAGCAITPVTKAEVLAGAPEDQGAVRQLIEAFPIFSIDGETADIAAGLRRQNRWKLADAFQAAVAVQQGLVLVTRDVEAFAPGKQKFVRIPYTL